MDTIRYEFKLAADQGYKSRYILDVLQGQLGEPELFQYLKDGRVKPLCVKDDDARQGC